MREIFIRLLKALWVFNIIYIVGFLLLFLLVMVKIFFSEYPDYYGVEEEIGKFIMIVLIATAILIFLQYILLGSFHPKHLLKDKVSG